MGSFSWYKVDSAENIVINTPFQLLIPKEFADIVGFNYIEDTGYSDFGILDGTVYGKSLYDIYELLALWNAPEKCQFDGDYSPVKPADHHTQHNRLIGIRIASYDQDMAKLKYPLRLVEVYNNQRYEFYNDFMSISDAQQGFQSNYAERDQLTISKVLHI